ncbi:MAG TPA: hypothetical protein VF307_07025 [Candidatus Nanopelagicaceae bacterium]
MGHGLGIFFEGVIMLARRIAYVSIAVASLSILCPIVAQATPSPTAIPTQRSHPRSTGLGNLTKPQKEALSAANAAFALARSNAREGFDRAVADAKAIRDQAIVDAGKDKSAIKSASENFQDFYKSISHAYKIALANAQSARKSALAAVHIPLTTK